MATGQRANFRIGTESGHGTDHDKFAIDAVSGAITIGSSDLVVGAYNITLVAEVYDSGGALVANGASDQIAVTIEVVPPEVHFADQDNPNVAIADNEFYAFTILGTESVAGASVGTVQAILVNAATGHRPNFSISTEAGTGSDHASFAIDAVSGAITIGSSDLATEVHNITLKAEVYDSGGTLVVNGVSDQIDVVIDVLAHVEEIKIASQDDPDTAAEDDETYSYHTFLDTDVIGTIATVPEVAVVNLTTSKAIFSIRDTADAVNFAISRLGEIRIAVEDLAAGVYNIIVDVSLRDDADGAYRSPDSVDVNITALHPPSKAVFSDSAPTSGTVEAPAAPPEESTDTVDGRAAEVVDLSAYVDNAGGHDVTYGVTNADGTATDLFEISEDGVLSSTDALLFYDDDDRDTYNLTITLVDNNLGGIDPDELAFTVTVEEVPPGTQSEFDVLETQGVGDIEGALIRIEVDGEILEDGYRMNADLSGDASEVFAVADDGQISVLQEAIDANVLDLDAGGNPKLYILTIEDAEGTRLGQVTINVKEMDEPPVFDDPALTVTVDQTTTGEFGGPYTATDPEGTAVTFSIKEPEAGTADLPFVISSEGQLSVASGQILDADNPDTSNEYLMTIVATDATGIQAELAITVLITNYSSFIDFISSLTPGTDGSTNYNPFIDFISSLTPE